MTCCLPSPRLFAKASIRVACAAMVALLVASSEGRADYISSFSGSTNANGSAGDKMQIQFSVLNQTGSGPGNAFGSGFNLAPDFVHGGGSAALDTSAQYLYVFEVVNNSTSGNNLTSLVVPFAGGVTSFGYFTTDGTSGGNNLQLNGIAANSNPYVANAPPQTGSTGLSISTTGVANLTLGSSINNATHKLTFSFGGVAPSSQTTLFGFTSNGAPGFTLATASTDGPTTDTGFAPSSTPEPATLLMAGLALPGALLLARRRKAQ